MTTQIAKTHELTSKILQLVGQITQNYLALGEALCTMRDGRYYRHLGIHIETLDDFFVEIRLGRSTAYNLMEIYEKFGRHIGEGAEIEYTRLVRALPVSKKLDDTQVTLLIENARLLPSTAFYDNLRNLKGQVATDECDHLEREALEKCLCCGKMMKIT